jgi:hypothetical protein
MTSPATVRPSVGPREHRGGGRKRVHSPRQKRPDEPRQDAAGPLGGQGAARGGAEGYRRVAPGAFFHLVTFRKPRSR